MSDFGRRFVVDTNVLVQLRGYRRATAFFRKHAALPTDVLAEAEGFPDIAEMQKLRLPTTARTLTWLIAVMASVPTDDTKLVDLYANKGGADPLVVACALECQELDSQYLDAPEWIVVTSDDAVRHRAEVFGLRVLSSAEFAAIIDASEIGNTDDLVRE